MLGLMMDRPLLISQLIEFGARYQGGTEIVTRTIEGPIHRYTFADAHARSMQLACALQRLGDQARRPGRDPGLEYLPTFRALFRHIRYRRGMPHAEPAPVRQSTRLHHQSC